MSREAENTEPGPFGGADVADAHVGASHVVPHRRVPNELRTALAVGLAALLVVLVVIGGGLAWAFWSFSRDTAGVRSADSPEPPSPAGSITATASAEATAVPDVVSLPLVAATKKLSATGLQLGAVTRVFADGYPTGAVVAQSPASAAVVNVGSDVRLTVCKGSLTADLPSVVGMTVAEARRTLGSAGLSISDVHSTYDQKVNAGLVLSLAASGARQPQRGDSVSLTISKGRAPVPMPAITGMTPSAATAACAASGLGLALQPSGAQRGIVYRQSPAVGSNITPGSSTSAWVDVPPNVSSSAKITKLDDTWEKYNKNLGAHVTCTSTSMDDRKIVSQSWKIEGLDVSVSGNGSSISFILPGYRRYGSTSVTLTVVDSAGQSSSVRRILKMNWDTGTLQ